LVRTRVGHPRRYSLGIWAGASWVSVAWSAAVSEPVFPDLSRAATGSPVPPGPGSTKPSAGDDRRFASRSGWRPPVGVRDHQHSDKEEGYGTARVGRVAVG
jgi:hypothetical protein